MAGSGVSLMDKIQNERKANEKFDRAHRKVRIIMAAWAAVILLDRVMGAAAHAYEESQLVYALGGGAVLMLVAFLGTRGHIQGAMLIMQINLAVFMIQFAATCFLYRGDIVLWSTLIYALGAAVLLAGSLMLFLNRDLEQYRARIRQLKGKDNGQPRYYRDGARLVRNKK